MSDLHTLDMIEARLEATTQTIVSRRPAATEALLYHAPRDLRLLLDVAKAAKAIYFVFGEGAWESVIHRNDLGDLKSALAVLDGSKDA